MYLQFSEILRILGAFFRFSSFFARGQKERAFFCFSAFLPVGLLPSYSNMVFMTEILKERDLLLATRAGHMYATELWLTAQIAN